LYEKDSRDLFFDKYYSWLSRLFDQGAELTGYVVKSHWLPSAEESAISDFAESRPQILDKIQIID
jgi:hypothetical protein